jgi:hypothetical protein
VAVGDVQSDLSEKVCHAPTAFSDFWEKNKKEKKQNRK